MVHMNHVKGSSCLKKYTHEISIFNGLNFMTRIKVFSHASNTQTRAMTLAPWTFVLAH